MRSGDRSLVSPTPTSSQPSHCIPSPNASRSLAQTRAPNEVSVAVAIILQGVELTGDVAKGKRLPDLRRWLPGSQDGILHAPLFALAAWKTSQTFALHSAVKGSDPAVVASLLSVLPAATRAGILSRVEDAEAVQIFRYMDEQMVGHTLVEMEEERVLPIINAMVSSDDYKLQDIFAASAEYQHARKGLYRATNAKVLDRLTKIFDAKPPPSTEAVRARVEVPTVVQSLTAYETKMQGQMQGAFDDMGSAAEIATWVLENGPVATALAVHSCRAHNMMAVALLSLPGECWRPRHLPRLRLGVSII